MNIRIGAIGGAGGGSSSGKSGGGTEAPDTLQSDQVARLVDLISEGEIEGFAGPPLQNVFFNGVPVQNPNGSFNFNGVAVEFTPGLTDQAPLPGFADVETVVDVNTQLLNEVPIVRAITDPDADRVIVTIQIPSLYQVDATGNVNPTNVAVTVDVQPNGGSYATVINDIISGKSSSTYQRSYNVPLSGAAPWNVRLTRHWPNSVTANTQDQTFWLDYTIVQDFKLIYPDSALVGIQADARLFGTSIPTRTYLIKGVRVAVPANYDPVTRAYTGIWDGTFKTAWTDNPAWVFYDLLVSKRYGLGQYVDATEIDKFGLYQIAQYCDGLVPEGAGGLEPRYRFNGVIAKQEDAIRVLMTIASVFRGMVYWGINGVTATADMPRDPVKIVAPGNVVDGMITYSGPDLRARHTAALVTWWNPALAYANDIIIVEGDPDDIARFGWRPVSLVAYGCTSRGQAYRMGKWLLDTEKNGGDTATWQASWDHADIAPGESVLVSDPAYAGVRHAGRVKAVAFDGGGHCVGITLDSSVTLGGGVSYTINVALPDGSLGEAAVANGAGATGALNFSAALPQVPLVNAMWVLIGADVAPRQFMVLTRSETAKNLYDITAPFNDPSKYERIEQNVILEPANYTALPSGAIPPPTGIAVKEGVTLAGGTTARALAVISWTSPGDPRITLYELQLKLPGATVWTSKGTVSGPSADVLDLLPGTYGIRARSLDALGVVSTWLENDTVPLLGLSVPPAAPVNLRTTYVDDTLSIAWDLVDDFRPLRYAVRKGDTWDTALELGTLAHPPFAGHGDGNYLVKSYIGPDAARIYSVTAGTIELSGVTLVSNVIAIRDEQASGWPGIFTGTVAIAGPLIRTGGAGNILTDPNILTEPDIINLGGQGDGTYEMAPARYIDNGRVAPCRVTVTWKGTAAQAGQNILAEPDLLNLADFLGNGNVDLVEVYPEISWSLAPASSAGDVFAMDPTSNPGNDVFSAPDVFSPDVSFCPWQRYEPGVYVGRTFRARLVLKTHDDQTEAVGLAFAMTVDVQDRLDTWALVGGVGTSLTDISVPSGGLTLVFASNAKTVAEAFNGGVGTDLLPHIQITNTNGVNYDFQVTGLTKAGCAIFAKQSGVAVTAPHTNIQIQGY